MSGRPAAAALAMLTAIAAGLTGLALFQYEDARARWSALSADLGAEGYDASASDAAYAQTEALLPWIAWSANATAVLVIAMALAIGALAPREAKRPTSDNTLLGASLVDLGLLVVAALPLFVTVRADPGLGALVTRVFPAVALAWIAAAAASGRTLGARAMRVSLGTEPGAEMGLRLLLAQPILFVMPALAVMVSARAARSQRSPMRWLAPHLVLARVVEADARA